VQKQMILGFDRFYNASSDPRLLLSGQLTEQGVVDKDW